MGKLHLNHMRLRDKWLLMYVLSVFIPIVLTNVVFYHVTTTNIKNQKHRDASVAIDKTGSEIQALMDEAAGVSYIFFSDPLLNETLDRDYRSSLDYIEVYQNTLRSMFDKYNESTYQSIQRIEVYSDNKTLLASGSMEYISDTVRSMPWYKELMNVPAPNPVLLRTGETLSLLQRLDNYKYYNGHEKFVKITLNMGTFQQRLRNSTFDGELYLVNREGHIVSTNVPGVDWKSGSASFASLSPREKALYYEVPYTTRSYLSGWSLHGTMNDKVVLEEVRKSWKFLIYLACLNFVIPSIIIIAMSRSIHVRLVRILRHMKKVKNQHFEEIPDEEYRDEIGQLTAEFNRMTSRIRSLIDDVYIADIQKKDSELKQRQAQLHALQSQINPHFMFNVLETVRMRSLMKGEGETAKIIQHMAKIFRKSISWGRDWVSVRDEMELIERFLEIQKYRFGDKLDYRITVEPAAGDLSIPKMTLLPFVENASIHGIETSPRKGLIVIGIAVDRGSGELVFSIRDNGVGMCAAKLNEILGYLEEDDSMGDRVGMKNAYYRLRMWFGGSFRFHIESEQDIGTFVSIRLPLEMGEAALSESR
ncbi:cache domain-containing sensor histidine kinase [Paenibacillus caseinilyticus]|uniref:Membrane protein n=1 Tax=Paenibacillus mucilaginosus K02 TaxID=997761 RepID=I0BDL8_9BACL|nr:sensor histidine kinase [Paenibacillus mucilaginosus]AFH60465.1 membrane protein [Paenibacillus mucilaginosus K02]